MKKVNFSTTIIILILSFALTSCHIARKIDRHVAGQFNNQLPKPDKRADTTIAVKTSLPSDPNVISVTTKKWKHNLPLILYWKYDYRHTCLLNPAIGVNYVRKSIHQQTNKLKQKLNGQQLELTIEQIPQSFAIVDKGTILLLLISWNKFYVEPDAKDLIVSYKVLKDGTLTKSGRLTISNVQKKAGIRFAQSLRSCVSEFLGRYNTDMTEMSKMIVNKLMEEF